MAGAYLVPVSNLSLVRHCQSVGYRRSLGNLTSRVTRSIGECLMSLWSAVVVSHQAHGSGGRQEALACAGKICFVSQFGPRVVQGPLDWAGLFVPKPTHDVTYHTLTQSDLPCTVRGRPLASAGVTGGCYSVGCSRWDGHILARIWHVHEPLAVEVSANGHCVTGGRTTLPAMSEDHSADRARLLEHVPSDGSAVGNTALIRALGWSEHRYWYARDCLLEEGTVARARGRGGAVRRVLPEEGAASETTDPAELVSGPTFANEREEKKLYCPIKKTLENFWVKERKIEPLAVEITAAQGRRATGGRWTRPDLVIAAVRTYRYLPGKYIEVVTFEVKPFDAIDVTAVYEALAHLRSATHAYVVLHVPDDQYESVQLTIEEICHVARAHGVGVIVMGDPAKWDTWEEKEAARRVEPDPQRLDEFIAIQLPQTAHDEIARALH
jgi:hypothetical protein